MSEHTTEKDAAARDMLALLRTLQSREAWHPDSPASEVVARAERAFAEEEH